MDLVNGSKCKKNEEDEKRRQRLSEVLKKKGGEIRPSAARKPGIRTRRMKSERQ